MTQLTPKEREIISGRNFIFIATINPDGSPQVTPLWAETDGDLVVINTEKSRRKARNMARDPRVALSAYTQTDPYDDMYFRAEVVETTEVGAREHIDKLSQKYLGKPYPWLNDADHRVIIKLRKV
jgi:PPOX class probable F420-dependent enzyme